MVSPDTGPYRFTGEAKVVKIAQVLNNSYLPQPRQTGWKMPVTGFLPTPEEQANNLQEILGLTTFESKAKIVSYDSDGTSIAKIVFPFWQDLAKRAGVKSILAPERYGDITRQVWNLACSRRYGGTYNLCMLNNHQLHMHPDTVTEWQAIELRTPAEKNVIRYHCIPLAITSAKKGYRLDLCAKKSIPHFALIQVLLALIVQPNLLGNEKSSLLCLADRYKSDAGMEVFTSSIRLEFGEGGLGLLPISLESDTGEKLQNSTKTFAQQLAD